jgi:hypothetical protein
MSAKKTERSKIMTEKLAQITFAKAHIKNALEV